MEGRAIARPNLIAIGTCWSETGELQWRAGQLPGQTILVHHLEDSADDRFNGGPGNCPAKPDEDKLGVRPAMSFNGGPGNCPAKRVSGEDSPRREEMLQWRAGQLPGQTSWPVFSISMLRSSFNGGPGNCPAKPWTPSVGDAQYITLQWRAGQLPGQTYVVTPICGQCADASMEGRAIARPNSPSYGLQSYGVARASMEGRAIARPNPADLASQGLLVPVLQWRAGQLPGQTWVTHRDQLVKQSGFNGGPGNCPAKLRIVSCSCGQHPRFNGGPGNCPAKLSPPHGQTRPMTRFNGGPGNCPAKLSPTEYAFNLALTASMEGRAIARPNLDPAALGLKDSRLQWRAGQLPGQTAAGSKLTPVVRKSFNGGPGNCPAKLPWGLRPIQQMQGLQWRAGQLPGQTPHKDR